MRKANGSSKGSISRRTFVGGSAALATMGLPAPGARAQTEAPTPKRGGILKVSAYLNPSKLDPVTGNGGQDQTFLWTMFDTLTDFEPATMKPRPGLAKWSYPDPKTMVLELNPNITFHDGTPCDAEAVRWNLDRCMNYKLSAVKPDLASIASMETDGPLKVILHLKNPDTSLPLILSERTGMVSSPKAVQAAGDDYDRKPCGTGQFKFVSWADGDRVIVTRNENYWKKDRPYLDGINFRIITDYTAGAHSITAGENDLMYLVPPRLFTMMGRDANLKVIKAPSIRTMNLFFNYSRGPLANLKVRQAINYAIDRVGFTRVTTDGTGEPTGSLITSQHWAADPNAIKRYPYDPDKAKALLAEAGYADGMTLEMIFLPDAEYRKRADIMMDNLGKVGIKITPNAMQQTNQYFNTEKKGDMYLVAWPGKPDMTQTYFLIFAKNSYYNPSGVTVIENAEDLINATRTSEDLDTRKAAFAKLIEAERDAASFAPICHEQIVYAMRKKVKGFEASLLGKPKFDGVWLDT
jgi:ABC-type transport system substrate-binding protein